MYLLNLKSYNKKILFMALNKRRRYLNFIYKSTAIDKEYQYHCTNGCYV